RREGLVWRGSLRHKFLVMHARVLVSSYDIDAYMLPPSWNMNEYRLHAAWRVGARRVFLQHGVTEKGVGASLALGTTGLSLMCSAGPREREYLQDATGYSTEVVETGFSRFDFLARTESPARRVLLMPTWRKYLVARSYVKGEQDPGTFEHSRFRQFYAELLASERLGEVLERFDSTLDVIPHYEIREHFKTIPVGSTRIFVGDDAGTAI